MAVTGMVQIRCVGYYSLLEAGTVCELSNGRRESVFLDVAVCKHMCLLSVGIRDNSCLPSELLHLVQRTWSPDSSFHMEILTQSILIHGTHTTHLLVFSCLQGSLLHMDHLQHSLFHACPRLWRIYVPGHRRLRYLLIALIFHREELPNVCDPDWDQDPACSLRGILLARASNW